MTMGDRVAVLKDGVVQQVSTPRQLYAKPANVFVAGFIGSPAMNLITLPTTESGLQFGGHTIPVPRDALTAATGRDVVLGVRPEHVEISTEGIAVDVDVVEELGAEAYVFGHLELQGRIEPLVLRVDWRHTPAKGDRIHVTIDADHIHLFATTPSGERLQ